jgi:alpha-1,6-mannosyltransferase
VPSLADILFLTDAQLRHSSVDLAATELPPRLRPRARLGVLDITEFYGDTTGGVRTYLREKSAYVESHPDLRHTLVLPGAADAITSSDGVRIYRLRGPLVPTQEQYRFMLATRSDRRIMVHERPDVIEVGSPGFVPWIVRLAARGLDIPVVAFYHSNFPRLFSPWPERSGLLRRAAHNAAWRYARLIDRHFAHTIVCSRFVGDDLRRAGIDRISQVPLGVDLARYHPALRAQRDDVRKRHGLPDGPIAGFVGRFGKEKELDVLVAAWPQVHRKTGALLVLVGDGPQRPRLEAQAKGATWLRFLPFMRDRDALASLLAAFDIVIAPGSSETFGLAPLEAMACGTPVLSADRGGMAEQIEAAGAGERFASGQSGSLAESAIRLLESDLVAHGRRGRAHAEANNDWNSVFDRIFAVYERVAAEHGARGNLAG